MGRFVYVTGLCIAVGAMLAGMRPAGADAPRLISYQGKVTDAGGTPAAGPVDLTVRLSNAPVLGVLLFGPETHNDVPLSAGVFTILIGSQTVGGVPDSVLEASELWLGVQVDGGAELTPRVRLSASPYALRVPNSLNLGTTSESGTLALYRTSGGTKSIELVGSGSRIVTYGSDGLEQIRLWGPTYGEIQLRDNTDNDLTVSLSATSNSGGSLSLFGPDGTLRANLAGSLDGANFILRDSAATATVSLRGDLGGEIAVADRLKVESSIGGAVYAEVTKHSGGAWLRTYDEAGVNTGYFGSSAGTGGFAYLYQGDGQLGMSVDGDSGGAGLITVYQADGGTGVYVDGDDGGAGAISVRNTGGLSRVYLHGESTGTGGLISVYDADGTETVEILGAEASTQGAQIALRKADGTTGITLDADFNGDGRIDTQELVITGGSDLSEQFDVRAASGEPKPGMLVCIDPKNPGKLVVSSKPYDRTVAGVLSGAGGLEPGMMMGQKGSIANGEHPVALTGRVYCLCDASHGAIRPGDLLTTSKTAGHAMRVKDYGRAHGAIIGKAMTGLAKGKGLVLVLVSLQ